MSTDVEQQQRPESAGDEDDDRPALSARALEALREFLSEQSAAQSFAGGEAEEEEEEVRLVAEDWRLSQFWYDRITAETLAEEIRRICDSDPSSPSSVACIACPTLYVYLKKLNPDISANLLEYDKRFEQYGDDFVYYDYNQPEELPAVLKHACNIIVVDPPYLSKECLEKVAQTVSFLARPQGPFLLLLTGEVQKDRALELLNVKPCSFRPQHANKLGNEFRLFTNYDPAERLGGWERN
ncbi:protein-lysine N-methyltransferase N6AMT2-like isoform X1 [Ananas comosus]|uniref:Protein-lysine N-methyltransferase ACMD2_03153 n=1 Tax=Ananas comosus TaxID=4615 RepID=A0A199VFE6_ANACO|nr:protein-lysine N-methyltransferase N6AMT2-like isoform X1 [Ananas comosus]OAY75596.1 Protein-lysine N-methyltransferase n6amt2 [Ananas comosus]